MYQSAALIPITNNRFLIGSGHRIWSEKIEDRSKPAFYFPDFFLQKAKPWFQHEHNREVCLSTLLEELGFSETNSSLKWSPPCRELFEQGFQSLQNEISKGSLIKGVPYVFETSCEHMDNIKIRKALVSLLQFAQKHPIIPYAFWDENEGMLGATPESLYQLTSSHLSTMACAGTLGHHESIDSFMNDPKERDEHMCVVKGIVESLAPFGNVHPGEIQVLNLGNLSHLVTPIQMELNSQSMHDELIRALHPTPALGTFPKHAGISWLRELDCKLPRLRYGAPVGVVMPSSAYFYVGIRNIQWDSKGIKMGAGCGVNALSDPEREWNEIHRKLKAIKEILSLG